MKQWYATVEAGSDSIDATWHGIAESAEEAQATAIRLFSALWRIRLGERPTIVITASAKLTGPADGGETSIGIWHKGLVGPPHGKAGEPPDAARTRLADAILRLALPHAPPAAHGRLTVMTGPAGERRDVDGDVVNQRISAEVEILPDDRARDKTPIPVRAPPALGTAIVALAMAGAPSFGQYRDMALPASASLRAILQAGAAGRRGDDARDVATFLRSLGLDAEAAALQATL